QRRQSERTQFGEAEAAELAAFVTAEYAAQHFLREPAIERAPLPLVVDVLEVIVEDGDVAHAVVERVGRDGAQQPGPLARVRRFPPAALPASKGKSKQVLQLATLVARQRHAAAEAKQQAQMPEAAG